jgi:hypothetical protein
MLLSFLLLYHAPSLYFSTSWFSFSLLASRSTASLSKVFIQQRGTQYEKNDLQ